MTENNNKIVGYLLGEFKNASWLSKPKVGNISNFGVSENYRRKGIGKQLMDYFFNICKDKEIQEIRLGVYNKNTSACKFYEDYGFSALQQTMILDISKK